MKLIAREVISVVALEATKALLSSGELIPIVGCFASLLTMGIVVCENAKCNRDAFNQLKGRLCEFAELFLGEYGLTKVAAERNMNSLLQSHVSKLEKILEEGMTYLKVFTKVGFLSHLMGRRHQQRFSELDADLTNGINHLAVSLQITSLVDQTVLYKVVLDIQAKIYGQYGGLKNVHSDPRLLADLAGEIGASEEDLRAEVADSLARIEETVNQVDENVRIIRDAMQDIAGLKSDIKSIIDRRPEDLLPAMAQKDAPVIDKARVLGRGSFGVIYAAEYLGEEVAVKVIVASQVNSDILGELSREVLVLSKVCHLPGVVRMFGANLRAEPRYIILERADCSLHDALHHRSHAIDLSLTSKIALLSQLSGALEYVHQLNFIHRDIKSSNVLLFLQGSRGRVTAKLSDFGLAKPSADNTFAQSQSPKGSPPYMAPEAFQGKYSFASDSYSMGVMANELLAEERPFAELNTAQEIWYAVIDGRRPKPFEADALSLVGCRLESLVGVCWSNDAALRLSANKIHRELLDLLKLSAEVCKHGTCTTLGRFPTEAMRVSVRGRSNVADVTADAAIRSLNSWLVRKCGILAADSRNIARSLVNTKKITTVQSLADEVSLDEEMLCGELGVARAYETKIKDALRREFIKALTDLSVEEVVALFDSVHMSRYSSALVSGDVNGMVLASLESVEELAELGISSRAHCKALLAQIAKWREVDIPVEVLRRNHQKMALPPPVADDVNVKSSSAAIAELEVTSMDECAAVYATAGSTEERCEDRAHYPWRGMIYRTSSSSLTTAVPGTALSVQSQDFAGDRDQRMMSGGERTGSVSHSRSDTLGVQHPLRAVIEEEEEEFKEDRGDEVYRDLKEVSWQELYHIGPDQQQQRVSYSLNGGSSSIADQRWAAFERKSSFASSRLESAARDKIMEVVARVSSGVVGKFQPDCCEAVVEALASAAFESEPITELGLYALGKLAQRHADNRAHLSSLHACELVVNLLHKHGHRSPSLSDNFVYAIANLTYNCADNAGKFVSNDVVVVLLNILKIHGKSMVSLANCGLTTLANLTCSDEFRSLLGDLGACQAVVSLLQHHGWDTLNVALCGLSCIASLAFSHSANKARLGSCGAGALVMRLLQKHGETSVALAENALYACANLTDHCPQNTADLASLASCRCLVDTLATYGNTYVSVAKYGVHTVNVLAMSSRRTCKLFAQTGLADALMALMRNYCSAVYCNTAVTLKLLHTLHTLLRWRSVTLKAQLRSTGIGPHMQSHIVAGYLVADEEVKQLGGELARRLEAREKRWFFF